MLCIIESINHNSRRRIKYAYQKQPNNNVGEWVVPASIIGAGGLVGGGLYYLSKNQSGRGPSIDNIFNIKRDSILDPVIDKSIPLNADKWEKDSILQPKIDPSIPLNADKWEKDSILRPKIDKSIPLNADKWGKDSIVDPKNDPSIPLNADKWENDSILDPKIDRSIPLNADRW